MKKCPACLREYQGERNECPFCGVIFSKWIEQALKPRAPRISEPPPIPISKQKIDWKIIVACCIGVAAISIAVYLRFIAAPQSVLDSTSTTKVNGSSHPIKPIMDSENHFDLAIDVPADPLGFAANKTEFLIGNRITPWGFVRLKENRVGDWEAQQISVVDPDYQQKMNFVAVTWNGENYIGYTDGSWLHGSSKNIFTVHNPQTLKIIDSHPAPELLGCLAWDGTGYWAATRKNTEDSAEAALLYHFDKQFVILDQWNSSAAGCQGLAWDGSHLWLADVFSGTIKVIDTSNDEPKVLQTYNTTFNYLSGIAFDGNDLWVAEYGKKQLHRMEHSLTASWRNPSSEKPQLENVAEETPGSQQNPSGPQRPKKTSDKYAAFASPPYPEDEATVIEFSAETRSNNLYGSWRIYFGEEFFENNHSNQEQPISMPHFARYEITIRGGDLPEPIVRQYQAHPRENAIIDEGLASALSPGRYDLSLFIHVQFVDRKGTNRIINDSTASLQLDD